MNEFIIPLKGNIKHNLILDPGTWIFDERKINLDQLTDSSFENIEDKEIEALGKAWTNQRSKGSLPSTNENRPSISKEDFKKGSFGMPLSIFLKNAGVQEAAKAVQFNRQDSNSYSIPLEEAKHALLVFSHLGKPLSENGPLHLWMIEEKESPIKIDKIFAITII